MSRCEHAEINESKNSGRMMCGYGGRCPHQYPQEGSGEKDCTRYSNPRERGKDEGVPGASIDRKFGVWGKGL